MTDPTKALRGLVIANRILANEAIVDAFGHVSIRHPDRPDRMIMSCSRSPELVVLDDLMEFDLACVPIDQRARPMYGERFIHGAIYRARPDVHAVIHNHAYDVIPFGVTKSVKLRPVIHLAAGLGSEVPVWDIRDKFGDTNLLVHDLICADDLAKTLGSHSAALLRGHGAVVTGPTVYHAVHTAIALRDNARCQMEGMRLGKVEFLSSGEIAAMSHSLESVCALGPRSRAWQYWVERCGRRKLV